MLSKLIQLTIIGLFTCLIGCEKSGQLQKRDQNLFFVPTVFSPDGNGINDGYIVEKPRKPKLRYFEMTIYDKERKLYNCTSNKFICGWDGKVNGHYVSAGNYYCVIKYRLKGDPETYHIKTPIKAVKNND